MKPSTAKTYAALSAYGWVCGDDLVEAVGRRFSARIGELRHTHDYTIESRTCRHPAHHHAANVREYRLREPAGQLTLEVAS